MTEELKRTLAEGLAALGLTPPAGAVDKLALYCDELQHSDGYKDLIMATVCVLLLNPMMSYLLTIMLSHGIWGIWQATLISQCIWLIASIYLVNRDLKQI